MRNTQPINKNNAKLISILYKLIDVGDSVSKYKSIYRRKCLNVRLFDEKIRLFSTRIIPTSILDMATVVIVMTLFGFIIMTINSLCV